MFLRPELLFSQEVSMEVHKGLVVDLCPFRNQGEKLIEPRRIGILIHDP